MGEDKKEKKKKSKKDKDEAPEPAAEEKKEEGGGEEPKRAQRATSNVFALFNQSQIQEFKEAFTMIDQNRDGIIDESDLAAIYQQIGRDADPKQLKAMIAESPGQLNFTHFLNLFGSNVAGTDPEARLKDAFSLFDEEGTGKLDENYVKDLLMNVGDQFTKDEIRQVWKEVPVEGGKLDYIKFVQLVKRGKEEE
jgi:myosin regulatory light chain 12